MQTRLSPAVQNTPWGREAESILRSCVHCGFCNATCPTYQLLGDELDGPRGRIYQIKQALEGRPLSAATQIHLDRCLTCLSCETTCPSGVRYGRLVEIGRQVVDDQVPRTWHQRMLRRTLLALFPHPERFGLLLKLGQWLRPLLPPEVRRIVPQPVAVPAWPPPRHKRKMLVPDGCVQSRAAPEINAAAARVLDRVGISLMRVPETGCCGALHQHLNEAGPAREHMRRNIDAWWPRLKAGAEAIVMTAAGCGAVVKEYGCLLRDDPDYAVKAAGISAATRDLSEVLAAEELSPLTITRPRRVAFQSPCSLQHGQKLAGRVEDVLVRCGFELTSVADPHLCCGAAGTYSLLQAALAKQLRQNKLAALSAGQPQIIATANIGCLLHLGGAAEIPVRHWISLLDVPDATP
ncbi:MAG TPA: glycolate oxidase subunit GlcF [Gammaproteobacteria bacterium]|nr:glycolate oxidase subunit GlcF [Gammaproteobacteria bacterium]